MSAQIRGLSAPSAGKFRFIAVKSFLAVTIAFVFNALSRRFLFAEIFVFLCQMVLQFPLQGGIDEALGYDLHRFVEMSLR